ncbi:hypothetical protein [Terrisporobacter mayombei]|uniref:hypothetical protein n=1 Tax=Terrisporobacter mayombei TaxID=1541 RepID=UPI001D16DAC1|nr:hypothetical protein [Terrisporobacter mayombei]
MSTMIWKKYKKLITIFLIANKFSKRRNMLIMCVLVMGVPNISIIAYSMDR